MKDGRGLPEVVEAILAAKRFLAGKIAGSKE
jgi:hypothetical protein